jgi:cytoskeletal protein CcmA (bactofilin family)
VPLAPVSSPFFPNSLMTLFARRAGLPDATSYSVIDEQLVIRGEITTQGTIRVDGRIEGRLHRADTLIVGTTGVVIGDVEAREVIVGGSIEGCVVADGRVEIQATASVRGDVRSASMMLHEGGRINGHVMVDRHEPPTENRRLELANDRPVALPR